MNTIWLIPTAALALGLVIGYGLKKGSVTPAQRATQTAIPETRRTAHPPSVHASDLPASDSIVACQGRSRTDRIAALTRLYSTLDADRFAAEAKRLEDVPDDERFIGLFLLYGRWAETDPTAALDHLGSMGKAGTPFLPVLLQCWANADPVAAAAFYQTNPERFATLSEMHGGDAASHIAAEWARNDLDAALTWSRTLTGDAKDAALGSVLRELADTNPDGAWNLASGLTLESRTEVLTAIASTWGRGDYDTVERRIADQSDMPEETKTGLRVAALIASSEKYPEAALQKLTSLLPGEELNVAISHVIEGNLASHDAPAAVRWVMEHDNENYLNDHVTRIMPEYVRQDAKGARAFAESLPPGHHRDWAIYCYAVDAIQQNKETPEQLMPLTETIVDPQVQEMVRDEFSQQPAKTNQ